MNYEDGMTIFYDPVSKTVVVIFRGKTTMLKGPFPNGRIGIEAGERLCREMGWQSERNKEGP